MTTARQAIAALLRKEPAPFLPNEDSPWSDTLQQWVTQGLPTDADGKAVDPVRHFGYDQAGSGGWFRWYAKLGPGEVLEETDEWSVTRNGNGAAFKHWKHRSGTPEHVDFYMTSRAIWEREYRPLLPGTARARVGDMHEIRRRREAYQAEGRWVFSGTLCIWEMLRASLGDENMFAAMLEDPAWIHDFNRVYTDLIKDCYRLEFAEAGLPDGIWIYEDLGYRGRLFCRPSLLAELYFPYYRELVEFFHGYGLPVVLHSCGYQEPMIPLAI
ncbi:MAG: hypothetical protein PHR35_16005, partial [Kiritimatiellae bacterium]|nr:hypothetical protein [Kiritimatiellia bacterium]